MKLRSMIAALIFAVVGIQTATALDTIYQVGESRPKSGNIVTISPQKVVLVGRGQIRSEVPVNEIEMVIFTEDPPDLKNAKRLIQDQLDYKTALEVLEKIKKENITRRESGQDVEFFKALCKARLAIAGEGDVRKAGQEMHTFVRNNATSYHYFEAYEIVGDTLAAGGNAKAAIQYGYAKLKDAPWPATKLRADLLIARAHLSTGNAKEALPLFEKVLAAGGSEPQKHAATLGKARCLAATGKAGAAQGAKLVEGVIAKAKAEEKQLHAQAYNALGHCHTKNDDPRAAVLAYLHVDVLYFMYPAERQEAKRNLDGLWRQLGMTNRANQAGR